MPTITINDQVCEFERGQTVIQVANAHDIEIPQYCYHDGLSAPAQCRICLAEMWAPNPRNDNKVEPIAGGKLLPTCTTEAQDGMVIRADSPKSVANQRAVMEYLLINHPLDCPVCDQAGECFLQDYSYKYGRGVSRFEESKVKQAKKDLGPHVFIYADRCIMCTRCVRFAREVSGTAELTIDGRGNQSQIDVFPGVALDNELSANVIDLCPVGALLDKDFLFAQRVWFLKSTPSIDGLTASGDNLLIEHNEGKIYRVKPRTNLSVNKWWITDEVRYGWKFVHDERRLNVPLHRRYGTLVETDWARAYDDAVDGLRNIAGNNGRLLAMISPMLSCEDAYTLAAFIRAVDEDAVLAVGPVPFHGEDKAFPVGSDFDDPGAFRMYAEKAPNARGVRRVLEAFGGELLEYDAAVERLGHGSGKSDIAGVVVTGNYPNDWGAPELKGALAGKFSVLIDTLPTDLIDEADVVFPGATFAEKAGTFENARHMLQGFEQAIPPIEGTKREAQIALVDDADDLAGGAGGLAA
ncbi:MAG: molybdopterin-dependent oxidoreductase, partial [Planctomycetota bacterium]